MISNRERIEQEDREDAAYRKNITTGIITMEEYDGTNLNLDMMCGVICLKEDRKPNTFHDHTRSHIVRVSKNRKDKRYFIRKDGIKYYLDDKVKKAFDIEMNIYNREGI